MARRTTWAAHSMPHIVDATVDAADAATRLWATTIGTSPTVDPDLRREADYQANATRDLTTAATGRMIWIDKPLCRMIADTAPTVPAWTPRGTAPAPHGIMLFDTPVAPAIWVDAGDQYDTTCDGVAWTTTNNEITLIVLTRLREHRHLLSPLRHISPLIPAVTARLPVDGNVDATLRTNSDHGDTVTNAARDAIAAIGAAWLLIAQPTVTDETTTRITRRRRRGEGDTTTTRPVVDVSERTLRRRPTPAGNATTGNATGRTATTRWWVRGHWRQQPYGPGRKKRRPVFIEPHTAGAKNPTTRPTIERWTE